MRNSFLPKNNVARRVVLASIAMVTFVSLQVAGACSEKQREPFRDAATTKERNSDPATVIEFPDGFSNAASKCDHGNRLYSAYKGDANRTALAVVPQDPTCPQS